MEESCIRCRYNQCKCIICRIRSCEGSNIIHNGAIIRAARSEGEVVVWSSGCADIRETDGAKVACRCRGECDKSCKVGFIGDNLFA